MNTINDGEWTAAQILTPKVDETHEFLEIATDFANPLDIVREAISNAYDAKCSFIRISFEVLKKHGDSVLKLTLEDDGEGMDEEGLQKFFNLGSSTRREQKEIDNAVIGEKGHGTKIYLNSNLLEVTTRRGEIIYDARMERPYEKLHDNSIPTAEVRSKRNLHREKGTKIVITGYNRNHRELFDHDRLRDYVLWFSKHGSFEKEFDINTNERVVLYLKGVDRKDEERIPFGHIFPQQSKSISKLFDEHIAYAPDHYCRKWIKNGSLPDFPEIPYQAVFYLEGDKIKRDYNAMLKRRGNSKAGAYQVQERYGLWVSKDYIPVQRKNDWITNRGSEFTRFHAFINCQALRLTANRGSIENTPVEILTNLETVVRKLFNEIMESEEWEIFESLSQQANSFQTEEKEKNDYDKRTKRAKSSRTAIYKDITLIEPHQENGVYALFIALQTLEPNLFPFEIVDYDTHAGIDVLAKTRDNVDIGKSNLKYVEFKYTLTENFNHSFRYLHSIVCWKSQVQHEEVIEDVTGKQRKMIIYPCQGDTHTTYMLDHPQEQHKIQVYVLEDYLREKLGLIFTPRSPS